MPEGAATTALHVVFHGRVQGVWFRGFTVRNARELSVSGWVRNRRDGTVEALFAGRTQQVDELVRRCRRGPPPARVDNVVVQSCPLSDPVPKWFAQKDTA